MPSRWTYRGAGVDVEKVRSLQRQIGKIVERTLRYRTGMGRPLIGFGHYASLIDIGDGNALAIHTDGCGTKVLIAQAMRKYDTIGVDCVAMCVNDLICVGARPAALVDYIALEREDERMVLEIMRGLKRGARMAGVAIVGGETAIMPDVIKGYRGRGFDLSATVVGTVRFKEAILGDRMRPGDCIIGMASSGIHSNGLTLARRALAGRLGERPRGLGWSLGEELLRPTRIYVKHVIELIRRVRVHAIAHITGGGFTKLLRFRRYAKAGFLLEDLPRPPRIFQMIQSTGRISDGEMFRTFNMGVGMCAIVPPEDADRAVDVVKRSGVRASVVGRVVARPGIVVRRAGKPDLLL